MSSHASRAVAARLLLGRLQEQAVGVPHDVGLVPDRDLLAAVRPRVLEREPDDPSRVPLTLIGFTVMPASAAELVAGERRSSSRSAAASGEPALELDARRRGPRCSRGSRRGRRRGAAVGTPGSARAGRTAANRSRSWRSATFTLRNPVPTGVVIGPLIATRASRIASRVSSGHQLAVASRAAVPAGRSTHSMPTSVASRTSRAAAATSGPIPSPGIDRHPVRHAGNHTERPRCAAQKRSNRIERFTSWIAFVTWMPRGQASVQLKVVRQRKTPVFSDRIFSRSREPWSRES